MPHKVKRKINLNAIETRDDAGADMKHEGQQHHNAMPKAKERGRRTAVNQFPFTRNMETFVRSQGFYLYVVRLSPTNTDSDASRPSSPLQWSEVRWKELVVNWGRTTTFSDLLQMSTPLQDNKRRKSGEGDMQKKLILHCLPKAASTTLRRACYKNQKESCEAIEFPQQQDPFGYRNIHDFFRAVKECDKINQYCVQGGDAQMSVINYEGKGDSEEEEEEDGDERDPLHFVHMVPFRNFDDWVESAIKHIAGIDGHCDRVDIILDQCLGYRELYMELYPKSVLSLLIGMAFDANGRGISRKDKHHIMLYNYKDVDDVMTEVSNFFGMDPLPHTDRRYKEKKLDERTCPKEISEKFHKCHDDTLISADAIRGLEAERLRRRKNDRAMKTIVMGMNRDKGKVMSEN